ncbi:haloacid dehalogenase type II [Neptuniibacter sp.]|uniref:haloacid dehalogenase type II n=1 Tax=Neptuniibacter sp. TaxID=1962643 RepID=UPI0026123294|nr:haloacid dehalogenase type II [Neptuniibacter sp.]MCP4597886.1 haloacid dehalogenase type II [Neptuniibacter sp.]
MTTIAFDIYDTVIDTAGIANELETMVGGLAPVFSQLWRDKQLEYSFRRGLMHDYVPFPICTAQALEYTDELMNTGLSKQAKQQLLDTYKILPAYEDVAPALEALRDKGIKIYALSNGTSEGVINLLTHAGIEKYFLDIISVDEIQTYKPSPEIYTHFLERTDSTAENSWLVSGNAFDVLGAYKFGFNTGWIKRNSRKIMDPWGCTPDISVTSLIELSEQF